MKTHFIPKAEILNLYTSTLKEVSTFTLSEWLKLRTDDQFIVIEREFVIDVIKYIERNRYTDGFLHQDLQGKWNLELIKNYIGEYVI